MAVLTSEAVVLRTWPVQEADLIVSLFTRDYGKLRGVAKSALKSRKRFGGALEPMTQARAWFAPKPKQDLVRLDQLEIVRSPLSSAVDAVRLGVLSFYAEVLDEALPDNDPQETVFRLLTSVLEQTGTQGAAGPSESGSSNPAQSRLAQPWMAMTYFALWMTRLMGLLPDLAHCTVCHEALRPGEITFNAHADGLFCAVHRHPNDSVLTPDSWQLAQRMLRNPVSAFVQEPWTHRRGADLRRFAVQSLERHLERRLRTAEMLARMSS